MFANVITNPFLYIESSSLYIITTVCIFSEKEKIIKGHTLEYLTPTQYDNFSDVEETNQESKIANISAATFMNQS